MFSGRQLAEPTEQFSFQMNLKNKHSDKLFETIYLI